MAASERFLPMTLVSVILLSANTGVEGYNTKSCPTGPIIDLTELTANSSGFLTKSGVVYSPNDTWVENGKIFGCPCLLTHCIQLCCPLGYAVKDNDCVKDELTANISLRGHEKYGRHYYQVVNDACRLSSTDDNLLNENYGSAQDELVFEDSKEKVDLEKYCLLRTKRSSVYWARACVDSGWSGLLIWFIICMSVSAFFTLATFIVYTFTPELQNLRGSTFRSYLASLIGCVCLMVTAILLQSKAPLPLHKFVRIGIGFGGSFFGCAVVSWLNVMSFDVWREFRSWEMRSNWYLDTKKYEKMKLVQYSIYTWAGSVLYALIFTMSGVIWVLYGLEMNDFITYFAVVPMFGLAICNPCLLISTVSRIKQRKKEAMEMAESFNQRDMVYEEWFYSQLKLSTMMGVLLIFLTVAFYWMNDQYLMSVCTLQALNGILIYLIFAWKKRSFCNAFYGMLQALRSSCFRRDSTPADRN